MINRILFLIMFFLIYADNNSYCLAVSSTVSYQNNINHNVKNSLYAVLDIDKVVNNSIAYKDFKNRWNKISDKYQKEIEFYETQLLQLEKKVTSDGISKKDIIKAKQQIGAYEIKVQKLLRQRKEALEKTGGQAIEILRDNIDRLIDDYAKKNKINIVFSKDQVVYFASSIDITDFILEKLNSNLHKLEVDI